MLVATPIAGMPVELARVPHEVGVAALDHGGAVDIVLPSGLGRGSMRMVGSPQWIPSSAFNHRDAVLWPQEKYILNLPPSFRRQTSKQAPACRQATGPPGYLVQPEGFCGLGVAAILVVNSPRSALWAPSAAVHI